VLSGTRLTDRDRPITSTEENGVLRLQPRDGAAQTERAVHFPRAERPEGGRAVLEVDVRAAGAARG